MTFVLGYPLYQVRKRKVCDLCVRISTIPSEESVSFVLGYPLYQVRISTAFVAFVLGYPLYQVRKVCDLCVRISTIPSEDIPIPSEDKVCGHASEVVCNTKVTHFPHLV